MKRLKEPSTWAGFAALFQMLATIAPPQYSAVLHGATVVAGALAAGITEAGAQVPA